MNNCGVPRVAARLNNMVHARQRANIPLVAPLGCNRAGTKPSSQAKVFSGTAPFNHAPIRRIPKLFIIHYSFFIIH